MPLTFPAHQLPVLPLKLWQPKLVDATALCVGAAAPDLANPLGEWMYQQSHTAIGLLIWAVPFTCVACAALRWRAAAGVFSQLPDLGVLRLKSYGVLGQRRPRMITTLVSAIIGAGSHVVIDAFTHAGRWGANFAHLNDVLVTLPISGDITTATFLQMTGHSAGSIAAIGVFAVVGRHQLLETWYGHPAVEAARAQTVSSREKLAFWSIVSASVIFSVAVSERAGGKTVFVAILSLVVALLGAGCVIHPHSPRLRAQDRGF